MNENVIENSKTVVFILPFFHAGGVERWVSYAFTALKNNGVDVRIFNIGDATVSQSYFSKDVIVEQVSLFFLFKYLLRNNVICISSLTKINLLFSFLNKIFRNLHISTVHLSLSQKTFEFFFKYKIRLFLHMIICNLSNLTLAVSRGVEEELKTISPKSNITSIYNPCFNADDILPLRNFDNGLPIKFIAAGRLHHQKRFDVLIQAFCKSYKNLPVGSSLTIWGEGSDRPSLEKIIPEYLTNNIHLPGNTSSLFDEFQVSDVFILSSEYEGFGNVLAEALANGCQCVSFDIPHGPKEILANGDYGFLIDFGCVNLSNAIVDLANGKLEQIQYDNNLYSHLLNFTSERFKVELIHEINKLTTGEV